VSVGSYIRKLLEKSSSAPTNTCCGDEVSEESYEELFILIPHRGWHQR
jgi:hypothetical protein